MQPVSKDQPWPKYDSRQSYRWNYEHTPRGVVPPEIPVLPGTWKFCGLPVASPLGVAAGPLLNGDWVLYYASLGFDVLTYKTVRSRPRECYPIPNLQPVVTGPLMRSGQVLPACTEMPGDWAISFGMPSAAPDQWRTDIERTRRQLAANKMLSVSVVASIEPDWTIDDLADDFARCASWAVDAGAQVIEANFSCPNVSTCDGQLFQQPAVAALVANRIRASIGRTPLVLKIGHLPREEHIEELLVAVHPWINALSMTNCIAARVRNRDGQFLFNGEQRGIGGPAIREASVQQVHRFSRIIRERGWPITLIGVGGIRTADHVRQYLDAGAEGVQLATSLMIDPLVGLAIRQEWPR